MRLSYEVESGESFETRDLPFVIGVLGDFTGHSLDPLPRLRERKFVHVTGESLDSVLAGFHPRVAFLAENKLRADSDGLLKIDLRFMSIDDFEPAQVARRVRPLRRLLERRRAFVDLLAELSGNDRLNAVVHRCLSDPAMLALLETETSWSADEDVPSVLPPQISKVLAECGWTEDPWREWTTWGTAFGLFLLLEHVVEYPVQQSRDAGVMVQFAISAIEQVVSDQLDFILHHPEFKKLEATWRGLAYLLDRCQNLPAVKLKVLNASKRDVLRNLQRAPEFDQSALYKFTEAEFGVLGGEPFGIFVGAYSFSLHPEDVELLERLSNVAASAHCPFLSSLEPVFFQLESFADLDLPRSLRRIVETTSYAKWNSFRVSEDSRYVGLVIPRILLRGPYEKELGTRSSYYSGAPYQEQLYSSADLLWGNAAFALAAVFAEGIAKTGLAGLTTGLERGGLVSGLPVCSIDFQDCQTDASFAVETPISDERQVELSGLGVIALCHRKSANEAVFFDFPSCHCPRAERGRESLTAQARLSARLETVLLASRFAHYLKCILRDKFRSFSTLSGWQGYLESWINGYVQPDGDPPLEPSAWLPLGSASITIQANPGPYVIATISPRFSRQEAPAPLRLVVELPQMKGVEW